MDWLANVRRHTGGHKTLFLLVLVFGPTLGFPRHQNTVYLENVDYTTASSASTAEVLRNIQRIWSLTKPTIKKFQKQETSGAGEAEGAANALAYLTDSFGGQLAGQILSVILASVTGDVRGILGNSLNLFQTEDTRDRVQIFLDEISQNFLKLTGLGAFTSTKSPLQQSTPLPLLINSNQQQIHRLQPGQNIIPITPLQSGSTLIRPGAPALPSSSGSASSTGVQNSQQTVTGQQPIIYVLPSLNGGSSTDTAGTSGSKTSTASKVTSNSGDDDSEEDRGLWRKSIQID